MTPLDILDSFDAAVGRYALIATYEFDPLFFERRVLRKKGLASAERILLLMDSGRYHELIRQGLPVSGFNRRYMVIPIRRFPYVFHPKLYLLLGDQRASGLVGSSNCTNAGIAFNMELCSAFAVKASAVQPDSVSMSVLRQIYQTFRIFAADVPGIGETIEREFFMPIEAHYAWLHRNVVALPQGGMELLHSYAGALWPQVKKRLEAKDVRRITILAPFYDPDLRFLKALRAEWPKASLTVIAQQKYATLEGKRLAAIFRSGGKDRLLAITPPAGRRLHAKAFAFETNQGTYWLTGSPNATEAAVDGGNTETALWFLAEDSLESLFKDDAFTVETIKPAAFEAAKSDEPVNRDELAPFDLRLLAVSLDEEGVVEIEFDTSSAVQALTLRIRNISEAQPFLSMRLRQTTSGRASLELDQNQVAQIAGAAICELAGTHGGKAAASNPVALIQMQELFRKREAGGGGSGNPLRKIYETGDELVPYLDGLSSIRDAVEFLNHCSIRFEDGESFGRGFGSGFWKARDPFVGDTPTQWLSQTSDNSAENLRRAIWEFVKRHQHAKLGKHVRRGNLNGLPNFMDIFRTLNGLLLTYNKRVIALPHPVIPHPLVTTGVLENIKLMIGGYGKEGDYEPGFVDAINKNFEGDRELVRDRLCQEGVPKMLRAATEAMIDVRRAGLKLVTLDTWSVERLKEIAGWIERQGLQAPSHEDVRTASAEYRAVQIAA